MFKRKALRIFAGMLFGASGGVLWGVWYHASHWAALEQGDEMVKMMGLLYATMVGAFAGFFTGIGVGMARNSFVTMIVAGLITVLSGFLPAGLGAFRVEDFMQAHLAAAGLVLGAVLACAIAIPSARIRIGKGS